MSVDCGDFEKLVAKPKCKSKVWKHFGFPADAHGEIMDKKKIVCRLCKATIAYSGNTSNLTYHLQRAHSQELVQLHEDSADKPGPSVQPTAKQKQQSLPGIVGRSIPFPQDSAKHKLLVDATADFICQGLLPLRVVDESSFRRLLKIAEPRFQLPHRTHFTNKVIPAKYCTVRASVEKLLATVEKCTMTTDLWTAQHQQRSYISLTVHFADIDFELQSKCLQTLEVPQDHNASSLMEVLDSMLKDWDISEKVCGGIIDNGSNIVSAIGLMEIEHFPCFAHTLQLSIIKWPQCSKFLVGARSWLNISKSLPKRLISDEKSKRCCNCLSTSLSRIALPVGAAH